MRRVCGGVVRRPVSETRPIVPPPSPRAERQYPRPEETRVTNTIRVVVVVVVVVEEVVAVVVVVALP